MATAVKKRIAAEICIGPSGGCLFLWICSSGAASSIAANCCAVDKCHDDLTFNLVPNYTNSVWSESPPAAPFPSLNGNVRVDVVIVGGGITGITAACLLKRAGRRVAVLESRRIGKGESSKTTAHLTEVLDMRYAKLISRFGLAGARLAARGQRVAIERIAGFADELAIDCDFRRAAGYLYAEDDAGADQLAAEAEAAGRVGLDVALSVETPLPFPVARSLWFANQAQMHPRAYLLGLAATIPGDGSYIFEQAHVVDVDEGEPCRVITESGIAYGRDVIVAAHVPISNRLLLHGKLAAYRTYVVGVEMPVADPIGLFWDTAEPYHFIRSQRIGGATYLIVGGEDHKVGEAADTSEPFRRLEAYVRSRFGRVVAPTDYRWSGQIVVPADGLPYIGRNALSSRVFVATGYGGNGMTGGTLAGMILADEVRGVANPWRELYDATRWKPLASAKAFLSENVDYPKHLLTDRLPVPGPDALEQIASGEGMVLAVGGERLAVYRNGNGELSALSPVCTHLGCLVHWNTTEKSWDCPCHGSRFDPHGRILNGPAVEPLEARQIPRDVEEEEAPTGLDLGEGLPA
jgi:glycine/D-amino acid oxidase-like deaminating enzyme/nitrite reductase/ring-hydroxylating ferredoxin subunit